MDDDYDKHMSYLKDMMQSHGFLTIHYIYIYIYISYKYID